jgi:hypothetical protein
MWEAGLAISAVGVGCYVWLRRRGEPAHGDPSDGAAFCFLLIFGGFGLVIAGLR